MLVEDWGGKGVQIFGRRSCDTVQVSSKAAGLALKGCCTPLPWQLSDSWQQGCSPGSRLCKRLQQPKKWKFNAERGVEAVG